MNFIKEVHGDPYEDGLDVVTYHSENAPPEKQWMARYFCGGREYLPVYFVGETETAVIKAATDHWEADLEARREFVMKRRAATATATAARLAKTGAGK